MLAFLLAATFSTVTVPENPNVRGGRTIPLNVAVIPAKERHDDAIFVLAGGPGVAATNMAGFAERTFAGSGRDIVLVDARGTGKSNGLHCDFPGSDADLQGYFTDFLPPFHVTACHGELAARADLTQYTTRRVVEDLEAVRRKLGYKQVDLYGTSYGTRVAIEYMRRYPKRVRAAILDGVVPPSLTGPSTFAAEAQQSLERVIALCAADEKCHAQYPDLHADYDAMMKAAQNGIDLSIKGQRVHIGRGLFGEVLRNFLYSPEVYRTVPLVLHMAARGDWAAFGAMAHRYARGIRGVDVGFFLSVSCAEDIPSLDEAAARAAAKDTFLGAYRVDQQVDACKLWPRGAADSSLNKALHKPLVSSVPTLLVSGELDPATPVRFGDEVARTLRNAKHAVIKYGSHSGDTGGCQEKVMSAFVRDGSVKDLDVNCFAEQKPPLFAGTEQ
jgi:pimeloyl-ACP methyl ester carboxylesterase